MAVSFVLSDVISNCKIINLEGLLIFFPAVTMCCVQYIPISRIDIVRCTTWKQYSISGTPLLNKWSSSCSRLSDRHRVRLVLLNKRWISLGVTMPPRPLKYHYLQGREVNVSNIAWTQERGATSEHDPALLPVYFRRNCVFFTAMWYCLCCISEHPNTPNDIICFPNMMCSLRGNCYVSVCDYTWKKNNKSGNLNLVLEPSS